MPFVQFAKRHENGRLNHQEPRQAPSLPDSRAFPGPNGATFGSGARSARKRAGIAVCGLIRRPVGLRTGPEPATPRGTPPRQPHADADDPPFADDPQKRIG